MSKQMTFEAIGTKWIIDIVQQITEEENIKLLYRIKDRIAEFDKTYSRFRSDSVISEIARKEGKYVLPQDSEKLIHTYKKFYDLTNGLFTPLIGSVLVDAGYDAAYSLKQNKDLKTPSNWENVLQFCYPILTLQKPTKLDFGAAGKGYLIDIVGELIQESNINNYCVDAGGDIRYRTTLPKSSLKIALEDPEDTSKAIGVTYLGNKSLCGSAGSRRKWQNFHHIINPKTLSSPAQILATWVIADTTLVADALSTCLFFSDASIFVPHFSFEYLILYADRSVQSSTSFPAELFT